jgi:hypothetical protein
MTKNGMMRKKLFSSFLQDDSEEAGRRTETRIGKFKFIYIYVFSLSNQGRSRVKRYFALTAVV